MFYYRRNPFESQRIVGLFSQKGKGCNKCRTLIAVGQIQIDKFTSVRNKKHYHLNWFELDRYIPENNFKLSKHLTEEAKQQVTDKFHELNSAFTPTDRPKCESKPEFLIQKISVNRSTNRRAYVEVFKFFSGNFIANTLSLVCKEFYGISWDEELWHSMVDIKFKFDYEKKPTWRETYLLLEIQWCYGCHQYLENDGQFFLSPILQAPLCLTCQRKADFRLINKAQIKKQLSVDAKLLNLDFHKISGNHSTYLFIVLEAIYNRREQFRQELLGQIQDSQIRDEVTNIDLRKMDPLMNQTYEQEKNPQNQYMRQHLQVMSWETYNRQFIDPVPEGASEYYDQLYKCIRSAGGNKKQIKILLKQINSSF